MLIFLIGGIFLLIVLSQADFKNILDGIKEVELKSIIILFIMQIITMALINLQWYLVFKAMNLKVRLKTVIDINMTGTFFENITPAVKAGGEAAKVLILKKNKISSGESVAAVTFQKIISMSSFLLLSTFSLLWFLGSVTLDSGYRNGLILSFVAFISLIFVIIGMIIWILKDESNLENLPSILKKHKNMIYSFKTDFKKAFVSIPKDKKTILVHTLLSFLIWIFFPIKTYYIFRVMGIDLGFHVAAIITYLTYMIGMLPLLPGGMGTFEGSMALLLTPFSVALDISIASALILRFVTYWLVFLISAIYMIIKELFNVKEGTKSYGNKENWTGVG